MTASKLLMIISIAFPADGFYQYKIKKIISPHVIDLSFTITGANQKMKTYFVVKALFCCINIDYMTNFVKKCFVFLFFFSFAYKKRKEKYTLNDLV